MDNIIKTLMPFLCNLVVHVCDCTQQDSYTCVNRCFFKQDYSVYYPVLNMVENIMRSYFPRGVYFVSKRHIKYLHVMRTYDVLL